MSRAETKLLEPSPNDVMTPAKTVKTTPVQVNRSNVSLKRKTPKMAVATSSILSQMETDAAFAVFNPANKSNGPRIPPKKMIPKVLVLLPDLKSIFSWLSFFRMKGIMAIPAPR